MDRRALFWFVRTITKSWLEGSLMDTESRYAAIHQLALSDQVGRYSRLSLAFDLKSDENQLLLALEPTDFVVASLGRSMNAFKLFVGHVE